MYGQNSSTHIFSVKAWDALSQVPETKKKERRKKWSACCMTTTMQNT